MILSTLPEPGEGPEDRRSKSQYTSKKEMLTIIAIIIVVGIALIPSFNNFKDDREKSVCNTNLKAIHQAMIQYAVMNDDQLPPIYHVGDNGAPYLFGVDKKPRVWATLLQPFMTARASFECPAAEDDEKMPVSGVGGQHGPDFFLTYGMYQPMSSIPYLLLSRPQDTVVFAETSNFGAQGSYNPSPFYDSAGNVVKYDAFMIGYDDSNFGFSDETKWVTRLAVRNANNGYDKAGVQGRHPNGFHIMFVDGHRRLIKPAQARVENFYPGLEGIWRAQQSTSN